MGLTMTQLCMGTIIYVTDYGGHTLHILTTDKKSD